MRWERDTGVYFRYRIVESACAGMKVPDIGMVHDARRALPLRGVRWRQRPLTLKGYHISQVCRHKGERIGALVDGGACLYWLPSQQAAAVIE